MNGERDRSVTEQVADFPRQHALTQGFSLGLPRRLTVTDDRVLFLRGGPDHPKQSLWCQDSDGERLLADADVLMPPAVGGEIPAEERARRERARERGSGIVAYATDEDARYAVFALNGKLMVTEVGLGQTVQLAVDGPVVDPRPDPTGQRIAYVEDEALWIVRLDGTNAPRMLAHDRRPNTSWGLAEFVAGEEMGRTRGFWWSPDGSRLLAAHVDTSAVHKWWIAAPVDPAAAPTAIRYPAAGTPNAEVYLALVGLNGDHVGVDWDRTTHPYLADVVWTSDGPPTLLVQSRDQRQIAYLAVDVETGNTSMLATETGVPWIELIPGSPAWTADGQLVRVVQHDDSRRVMVGDTLLGGPDLMVASIVGVTADAVVVTAHVRARPWCSVVASLGHDGTTSVLSDPDGLASAVIGGAGRLAIAQRSLGELTAAVTVDGQEITSQAEAPPPLPVSRAGPVGGPTSGSANLSATASSPVSLLLWPQDWTPEDGPLPVLVDSYGGPHARRVTASGAANLSAAWFAANGYAVLVTDGPGAPGQSLAWEATIDGDLATPTLQGQADALERAIAAHPGLLDRSRVAIRGWSFGGYLAALAVMRMPEVFHAAVSGAPVTDWRLYDTHYTERYLGIPDEDASDRVADAYDRSSIIADAPNLTRPLMLIHGLADDNVVSAHTLRLSRALVEAGRPHQVLPLSGVTHFTPSADVNANLMRLQLDFLDTHMRRHT